MDYNDEMATRFFEDGERITAAITIQKSAREIYALWSGLTGLPRFVRGIEKVIAGTGSVVDFQAREEPASAATVSWQAEIINEQPGRMIAWRSVGAPEVPNAGSVSLRELPYSRGTEVRVIIEYIPPKGALLQRLDKAMGQDPKAFLQMTMFRFRQLLEAGEMATTEGQPAGRDTGRDVLGSNDEKKFAKMENHS